MPWGSTARAFYAPAGPYRPLKGRSPLGAWLGRALGQKDLKDVSDLDPNAANQLAEANQSGMSPAQLLALAAQLATQYGPSAVEAANTLIGSRGKTLLQLQADREKFLAKYQSTGKVKYLDKVRAIDAQIAVLQEAQLAAGTSLTVANAAPPIPWLPIFGGIGLLGIALVVLLTGRRRRR